MRNTHSTPLFFSLALVVIIIGYSFILGEGTITGAAPTTGKTYTSPPNTTSSSANDSAQSSGTASYQPNQSGPPIGQNSPGYVYSMPSENQSASANVTTNESSPEPTTPTENETLSEEHTTNQIIVVSSLVPGQIHAALPAQGNIKLQVNILQSNENSLLLTIYNPGSTSVEVEPRFQELPLILPHEPIIQELLMKESKNDIQQRLEMLRILEKEKVKPLHIRRVYHPFEFLTGALTYTKQRTSGQLLQLPHVNTIKILPGEQKQVPIAIPTLSAVGRKVRFTVTANGETYYNTTFSLTPSLSAALDVAPDTQQMDLYLSIPNNNQGEYFLEVNIGEVYYELFGPYTVGNESALFSQQFHYSFEGIQPVFLTVIKDGFVAQQVTSEVQFWGKI